MDSFAATVVLLWHQSDLDFGIRIRSKELKGVRFFPGGVRFFSRGVRSFPRGVRYFQRGGTSWEKGGTSCGKGITPKNFVSCNMPMLHETKSVFSQ